MILKKTSAEFVSLRKAFKGFVFRCNPRFEDFVCWNTQHLCTVYDTDDIEHCKVTEYKLHKDVQIYMLKSVPLYLCAEIVSYQFMYTCI